MVMKHDITDNLKDTQNGSPTNLDSGVFDPSH